MRRCVWCEKIIEKPLEHTFVVRGSKAFRMGKWESAKHRLAGHNGLYGDCPHCGEAYKLEPLAVSLAWNLGCMLKGEVG